MKAGFLRMSCVVAAVAGLALGGCGDSNLFDGSGDSSGAQADREAGLAALDAGNWDKAIEVFGDMDGNDPDVQKYLASAYLGKAGFDTLELVDRIAEDQESDGDGTSVLFDSVTSIFDDDGDGLITAADLQDKADLIELALGALGAMPMPAARASVADVSGMRDGQIFQAGLYSAVRAVLGVVSQLREDPNDPNSALVLTTNELACQPGIIANVAADEGLNVNLDWVREAVAVLDPAVITGSVDVDGNDIAADLDEFLFEVGYLQLNGNRDNADRDVTSTELQGYLNSLIENVACQ